MSHTKKSIVSLSGGMDSATVLAVAIKERGRENVQAVSFNYGSKHNRYELSCAVSLAFINGVPHRVLDLSRFMCEFRSALTDRRQEVPEGHYAEENMKLTVVPNRNMIFTSILAGLAVSENADEIWLGVHAGDHAIYPDCRPEFVESVQQTIRLATDTSLAVNAPFLTLTKKDILKIGFELGVQYEHTRTCYSDNSIACGRCGSCCERLESFASIGREDPVAYQDRETYKTFLKKGQ